MFGRPDEETSVTVPLDASTTIRRRLLKIGPVFLRHYLMIWIVMTVAFVFATGAIIFFSHRHLVGGAADAAYAPNLSLIIRTNAIFILLVTLFMGTYTLLLSHRMAGPAYRINNSIRRALDGDYQFQIVLRKNDFLHDVADNMNILLQQLAHRERKRRDRERDWIELQKRLEKIREKAGNLASSVVEAPGISNEAREIAKEILGRNESGTRP